MHQITFLLARRPDLSHGEFAAWLLERHVPLVRRAFEACPEIKGYRVVSEPDPSTHPSLVLDAVTQILTESREAADRVLQALAEVGAVEDSQAHTSFRAAVRGDVVEPDLTSGTTREVGDHSTARRQGE